MHSNLKHKAFKTQKIVKKTQAWAFLAILSVFVLSACGFHLKGVGSAPISFKSVQLVVQAGVRPDIVRALTQQFKGYGVKVVDSITQAELQIKLMPTGYTTSKTGVAGSGDTTSELIKMSQPFTATQVASEQQVLKAQVVSFRDHNIQLNQVLASDRELQSIHQQMANEIALQIIDRISRKMAKP